MLMPVIVNRPSRACLIEQLARDFVRVEGWVLHLRKQIVHHVKTQFLVVPNELSKQPILIQAIGGTEVEAQGAFKTGDLLPKLVNVPLNAVNRAKLTTDPAKERIPEIRRNSLGKRGELSHTFGDLRDRPRNKWLRHSGNLTTSDYRRRNSPTFSGRKST